MSGMVRTQIRLVRDCNYVKRFHTEHMLLEDTVGMHSANVAMICAILIQASGASFSGYVDLIYAALMHDLSEKWTGDTPAPFKRELRAKGLLDEEAEHVAEAELSIEFPHLAEHEKSLLKAADLLDLCFKCELEIELGNQRAIPVLVNGINYLYQLKEKLWQSIWCEIQPMIDKWVEITTKGILSNTGI